MKEQFVDHNFRGKSLVLVNRASDILDQYAEQGYRLTVRQLFYQLVSRGYIPNTQRSYKRAVNTIGNARLAGLIDWRHIEDRGRGTIYLEHWEDPAAILKAARDGYRIDRWQNQPNHVLVMVEKDALSGVLSGICDELDVRLVPNRGYSSLSEMYNHGKSIFYRGIYLEKDIHLLYLGDFDPSGLDMDRDIKERLRMFSYDTPIHFQRLALTEEQIEEYDPPPNPTKLTDSRAWGFIGQYGDESWELDALEPSVLRDLVEEAVLDLRDPDLYAEIMETEQEHKDALADYIDQWGDENED